MTSKNIYQVPFAYEINAVSDSRAHYNEWKHAIDFVLPKAVEILAAQDGIVWNVSDKATEGGNDEKYMADQYQNFITIKHENEEYSQYVHLAAHSATVKIGDQVKKGDVIAKGVDLIGFTTALHLHFVVFILADNELGWESIDPQFEKEFPIQR